MIRPSFPRGVSIRFLVRSGSRSLLVPPARDALAVGIETGLIDGFSWVSAHEYHPGDGRASVNLLLADETATRRTPQAPGKPMESVADMAQGVVTFLAAKWHYLLVGLAFGLRYAFDGKKAANSTPEVRHQTVRMIDRRSGQQRAGVLCPVPIFQRARPIGLGLLVPLVILSVYVAIMLIVPILVFGLPFLIVVCALMPIQGFVEAYRFVGIPCIQCGATLFVGGRYETFNCTVCGLPIRWARPHRVVTYG